MEVFVDFNIECVWLDIEIRRGYLTAAIDHLDRTNVMNRLSSIPPLHPLLIQKGKAN